MVVLEFLGEEILYHIDWVHDNEYFYDVYEFFMDLLLLKCYHERSSHQHCDNFKEYDEFP